MIAITLAVVLSQVTPPPPTPAALGGGIEQKRPPQKPATPATPTDTGPSAAAQKLSFAQQAFGLAHSAYRQGNISADQAAMWSWRIYDASKDTDPNAAKLHVERMLALEKLAKDRAQQGGAPMLDVMTIGYYRAQAEQIAGKK